MTTYEKRSYLLMSHDPVHIGAGGYRLGRVDNSIVREPGTRIPKIPGTSLHGAARSYAARLYGTPAAAGQAQDGVDDPDTNPICYTFGYIKRAPEGGDTDEGSVAFSGVVNVFDALVALFPVHSLYGPVWVSTKQRLEDAGFTMTDLPNDWPVDHIVLTWNRADPLNLGWLMLPVAAGQATVTAPEAWQGDTWNGVANRIVLVHESLFSAIVNSNLKCAPRSASTRKRARPKTRPSSLMRRCPEAHSSPATRFLMITETAFQPTASPILTTVLPYPEALGTIPWMC